MTVVRLGDVCRVLPGFAFKSSDLAADGIPVVKIGSIVDGGLVDTESGQFLPTEKLEERHEKYFLKGGDIVLAMTGEGKVGRLPNHRTALLNQRVCKIEPLDARDHEYLWAVIKTMDYSQLFKQFAKGAAQANISGGQLERIAVNWPQSEVRTSVGQISRTFDDLIANNRRRIALLEQSARLLYREWFVHLRFPGHEHVKVVDGVPEGWVPGSFHDVADVLSGGTPKTGVPEFWGGDIPFFTPKDARDVPYVLGTEKYLTEAGLSKCNSQLFSKDTVFITARGTVGKVALAQVPMAMNQSCYALRGKDHISQLFLYCALIEAIGHFKSQSGGAVFNAIVVDTFKRIPCLLPPEELVVEFTELASPIFQQIDRLLLQSQKLRQARELLLPRLMRGEIEV